MRATGSIRLYPGSVMSVVNAAQVYDADVGKFALWGP